MCQHDSMQQSRVLCTIKYMLATREAGRHQHAHGKVGAIMGDAPDCVVHVQAKPTHGDIIRFAPALTMSEAQIMECSDIIHRVVSSFDASHTDDTPHAASASA